MRLGQEARVREDLFTVIPEASCSDHQLHQKFGQGLAPPGMNLSAIHHLAPQKLRLPPPGLSAVQTNNKCFSHFVPEQKNQGNG